jgi:hypothetical protein
MELSTADCCRLAEALSLLAEGRWAAFEDRLWIAFGDDWQRLRAMLIKHRHITLKGAWKDEPVLTEEGRALLDRLESRPRAAAG